jgi:hypothetical protein
MNCHQMRELFSEYATGSLPRSLSDAAREHFLDCSECQEAYGHFTATLKLMDKVCEVKPPANLHSFIMAGIEESKSPKKTGIFEKFRLLAPVSNLLSLRGRFELPSRALATGFTLLAIFGIVNGFFPVKPALSTLLQTNAPVQVATTPTVVASARPISGAAESGLAMSFASSGNNALSINLKSITSDTTQYSVLYQTGGQPKYGKLENGQSSVISIASVSGDTAVARIDWNFKGRAFTRSIFVPGKMDSLGSGKRLRLNISSGNAAETLKSIAAAYGVAIITSGDVSAMVPGADISHGTPDDALYCTVARAGYTWRQIDSSVYLVEPRA